MRGWLHRCSAASRSARRDVDRSLPRTGLPALLPDDSDEHRHTLSAAAGAVRRLILDRSAGIDVSFLRCVAVPADTTSAYTGGILAGAVASYFGAEVQSLDSAACQHPCEHLSERARRSLDRGGSRPRVPGAVARWVGVLGDRSGHRRRDVCGKVSFRGRFRCGGRGGGDRFPGHEVVQRVLRVRAGSRVIAIVCGRTLSEIGRGTLRG
jgi:hypothetical protein